MSPPDARHRTVWLQRVLVLVAVLSLSYYGYKTLEAHQFQREQTAAVEALLDARDLAARSSHAIEPVHAIAPRVPDVVTPRTQPSRVSLSNDNAATDTRRSVSRRRALLGEPLGLLEIPRLKLTTPVMPGDDDATLDVAVGHLPDTPKPWEPGNSAFAAHRDGLFRPLKNIRVGDDLRVRTVHGDFHYRVRETRIVQPDDLSVLAPTGTDTVTLITCYPFAYVGSAPLRFIVQAERVEIAAQ